MADYKRMVSYMYQYESGIKKKNVGFARIEAKDGQCKITLHMQLLGQLDSIFPTYLIQRGNGNTELIYLGDTFLKNQVMDSRLIADEKNIMGSGYGLKDMGGLLLFLNDSVFFATEWDDKPVVAAEVLEALRPKSESKSKSKERTEVRIEEKAKERIAWNAENKTEKKTEDSSDNKAVNRTEQQAEEKTEKKAEERIDRNSEDRIEWNTENWAEKKIEWKSENWAEKKIKDIVEVDIRGNEEDSAEVSLTLEEELAIPKYKLPRGYKIIERMQKPDSMMAKADQITSKLQESSEAFRTEGIAAADINKSNLVEQSNIVDSGMAEQEEANLASVGVEAAEAIQMEEVMDRLKAEVPDRFATKVADRQMEETPDRFMADVTEDQKGDQMNSEQYDPKVATDIFEKYQRIYPFEDNEILLCVKIEPKDIGLLPKELWALSNNSFLVHGYYCYHHLIFAKLKNRNGSQFILGVPGIYHDRERFMAKMFGFECFKPIRRRELRQGDFGYWYMPVTF